MSDFSVEGFSADESRTPYDSPVIVSFENVYLSLGSNLGHPKRNIEQAIECIQLEKQIQIQMVSPFYLTEPIGFKNQPDFVNCVVWVRSSLPVLSFFQTLQKIEKKCGKKKYFKNGPRKIDIDILLWGQKIELTEEIQIPHPRMHERRFVLIPLLDIDHQLIHPVFQKTVTQLVDELPKDKEGKVRRL